MKRVILILTLLAGFNFVSQGQNQKNIKQPSPPPSDALSGYTYDFDKAKIRILDRVNNPNVSNQDAEPIVSESTFPKVNKTTGIDKTFNEQLIDWMEKNPNVIINAFKNRTEIVHQY